MNTEPKTYEIECEECGGKGIDPGSVREPETCLACNGAGKIVTEYAIGDVIEYRHDETHALVTATVLDYAAEGWLTVSDEGKPPEDDADIDVRSIVRVVAWEEYLNDERKAA